MFQISRQAMQKENQWKVTHSYWSILRMGRRALPHLLNVRPVSCPFPNPLSQLHQPILFLGTFHPSAYVISRHYRVCRTGAQCCQRFHSMLMIDSSIPEGSVAWHRTICLRSLAAVSNNGWCKQQFAVAAVKWPLHYSTLSLLTPSQACIWCCSNIGAGMKRIKLCNAMAKTRLCSMQPWHSWSKG